ncbi:hypothetical protein [Vulcanisaeta souniana]|uniref:HEAT repeat domain-containing protein n=1 Tax=Vulcanisaeta souniana JCM 11219 TaxID=1293586 RepID=A0A830E4V3_9CREN|nr:hypothetical protein [Vulcanisaeta souniana]BDR91188.1 hypothetical protein Vsou_02810 [Vulcanisaeta souniana JCM 11219]GGI86485.1 hypothetical protein GCM10007112_24330 [Vulcanisaeta souniana JCM 11219]
MSSQVDPIQIARLPENQREQQIRSILQMLFTLKEDQAFQALRGVIETLAKKATDDEYINWCKTTMRILASYPDEVVKAGLALRSRAVSSLDKNLQSRDQAIVGRVLQLLDEGARQKLMRNMK